MTQSYIQLSKSEEDAIARGECVQVKVFMTPEKYWKSSNYSLRCSIINALSETLGFKFAPHSEKHMVSPIHQVNNAALELFNSGNYPDDLRIEGTIEVIRLMH